MKLIGEQALIKLGKEIQFSFFKFWRYLPNSLPT